MRPWLMVLSTLLWVSSVSMVYAADNVWTSLGPEGGHITALAIDPLTPTTLYAGTEGSGVFQSTDGGSSWRAVNAGLTNPFVTALAIDPLTPTTLYAGTMGRGVFTTFILPQFTLMVSKEGTGSGTVTSHPAGISCGSTCRAPFDQSTSVTLTATAASASIFAGWDGEGCSGTDTCTVSMTQARSVTATFALLPQPLTVTLVGTGSGTVTSDLAGIRCPSMCEAAFPHGQSVTLIATAASASIFVGWDGEGCSGTDACTVSMTQARSVTATFNIQQAQGGGGGGGGCTIHPWAGFDPVLIGMVGLALVCLVWRRSRQDRDRAGTQQDAGNHVVAFR
jgi:Divergent InlB B-repeat domain